MRARTHTRWHTHLAPLGELDVRVLRQVRDVIRNLQRASVECGRRQRGGRSSRVCGVTVLFRDRVPQQPLLHHLIYTETKHRPVPQNVCSQCEIRHQTLQNHHHTGGDLFMHHLPLFLHHSTMCACFYNLLRLLLVVALRQNNKTC